MKIVSKNRREIISNLQNWKFWLLDLIFKSVFLQMPKFHSCLSGHTKWGEFFLQTSCFHPAQNHTFIGCKNEHRKLPLKFLTFTVTEILLPLCYPTFFFFKYWFKSTSRKMTDNMEVTVLTWVLNGEKNTKDQSNCSKW